MCLIWNLKDGFVFSIFWNKWSIHVIYSWMLFNWSADKSFVQTVKIPGPACAFIRWVSHWETTYGIWISHPLTMLGLYGLYQHCQRYFDFLLKVSNLDSKVQWRKARILLQPVYLILIGLINCYQIFSHNKKLYFYLQITTFIICSLQIMRPIRKTECLDVTIVVLY